MELTQPCDKGTGEGNELCTGLGPLCTLFSLPSSAHGCQAFGGTVEAEDEMILHC